MNAGKGDMIDVIMLLSGREDDCVEGTYLEAGNGSSGNNTTPLKFKMERRSEY